MEDYTKFLDEIHGKILIFNRIRSFYWYYSNLWLPGIEKLLSNY